MRSLIADTVALIVFSTIAGAAIEFFIAGLNSNQVLHARLAAVPVILITARPYGIYRDLVFRRLGTPADPPLKTTLLDVLAFVTFQAPVYAAVLAFAGATLAQAASAVVSSVVVLVISGRPYGIFLTWCRRLFRVP